MKPNATLIVVVFIQLILILSACSLPMKTQRIDSVNSPANGIRYILKRPSYVLGLRIEDDLLEKYNSEEKITAAATVCFKEEIVFTRILKVILEQNLNGSPLTFEVTTPNGLAAIPHIFSNTEFSITTDADATLKSISAGETDKSLEFIQAIAGIAVKAAAQLMLTDLEQTSKEIDMTEHFCAVIDRKEFKEYAKEHLRMHQQEKKISELINTLQESITIKSEKTVSDAKKYGKQISDAIAAITLLREEQNILKENLKKIKYELAKDDYQLKVDGITFNDPKKPLLRIELDK